MLGHGVVSTALFMLIGVVYDRFGVRLIHYYGGLATYMPRFAFFVLFFSFANMGFPLTANFVGEILIFIGLIQKNNLITLISLTGVVFSAAYSIWFANRLLFGTNKLQYYDLYEKWGQKKINIIEERKLELDSDEDDDIVDHDAEWYWSHWAPNTNLYLNSLDLTSLETILLTGLFIATLVIGIFPNIFLSVSMPDSELILSHIEIAMMYNPEWEYITKMTPEML